MPWNVQFLTSVLPARHNATPPPAFAPAVLLEKTQQATKPPEIRRVPPADQRPGTAFSTKTQFVTVVPAGSAKRDVLWSQLFVFALNVHPDTVFGWVKREPP